jgi:hypothetical protein
MAIGLNGPPIGPNPHHRSQPNSTQFNTFGGTRHGTKLIISRSRGSDLQRVNISAFCLPLIYFFVCSLLVAAPSKNGWADFDDLYVKRRGLAQGGAFLGDLTLAKASNGFIFPKIGLGIRIFSLNKSMNNFSTRHAILLKLAQSAQLDERNSKI